MKPILAIVVLLLASVLAAGAEPRSYPVQVVRVKDGDTVSVHVYLGLGVVLADQGLRLDGVDAPDAPADKKAAATRFTADWVAKRGAGGELVFVEAKSGPREKYGRLLGHLRDKTGADLGADLVAAGHAVKYDGGKRVTAPLKAAGFDDVMGR